MTSSKSKPAAEDFSRSHDYPWLVRRWRPIARSAGLRMRCCGTSGGLDVFHLHTKSPGAGIDAALAECKRHLCNRPRRA